MAKQTFTSKGCNKLKPHQGLYTSFISFNLSHVINASSFIIISFGYSIQFQKHLQAYWMVEA